MMAYIVLCGGVNGHKSPRTSSHGAKSVSKKLAIGYRAAQHALNWLQENMFITKANSSKTEISCAKRTIEQWVINNDSPDTAVSQQFLNGYVKESTPPILRLALEIRITDYCNRSQALIDAMLLYTRLIHDQDFGEWSGVNPVYWHHVLRPIESSTSVADIEGTDLILLRLRLGDDLPNVDLNLLHNVIANADSQEVRMQRFCDALATLKETGLVYQCITIWSHDPVSSSDAEPLCTLYVRNRWAREFDMQALNDVHKLAWKTQTLPSDELAFDKAVGTPNFVGTGIYHAALKKSQLKTACVVCQLRVRNWPNNEENWNGRWREQERTRHYIESLRHAVVS